MDIVDMMYNLIDNAKKKAKEANVEEIEAPPSNITPIRIKSKCLH
jgi:hypothetical protein